MSKTITEIIEEANTIATETVKGKNTAERVGGCIKDAAEFVQDFSGAIKADVESTVDAKMEEVDEKVAEKTEAITELQNAVFENNHKTTNPFDGVITFGSKSASTYNYGRGYTYEDTVKGVKVRSTGVGNLVYVYVGSTLMSTHTYTTEGDYENIEFGEEVSISNSNRLTLRGSFWFYNGVIDPVDGIDTYDSNAIHPDFWYVFESKCRIDTISEGLETTNANVSECEDDISKINDTIFENYIESNPFDDYGYNSKTDSSKATLYGYTFYGVEIKGIKIRSTVAGDTVNIYKGSNLLLTHTYTTDKTYEEIYFDEPFTTSESNPLLISGAFWWFNRTLDPVDGIQAVTTKSLSTSPVHCDFWFLFDKKSKLDNISAEIDSLSGRLNSTSVIIVDCNGKGQYETITDAVNNAPEDATIIVYPGTYNEMVNMRNHAKLSLIGINKESCIIKATDGNYGKDPLAFAGVGLIANLTIISTHEDYTYDESTSANIKNYCIHVDNQPSAYVTEGTLIISNCIMRCYQGSCLGMGSHSNWTVKVENCDLYTEVEEWSARKNYGAIYMHAYNGEATNQNFILINNRCYTNTNYGISVSLASESTEKVNLSAYNNISYSTVNGHKASIVANLSLDSFGNSAEGLNA